MIRSPFLNLHFQKSLMRNAYATHTSQQTERIIMTICISSLPPFPRYNLSTYAYWAANPPTCWNTFPTLPPLIDFYQTFVNPPHPILKKWR